MIAALYFARDDGHALINLANVTEITRSEDGEGMFWIHFLSEGDGGVLWEYASREERDRTFERIGVACGVAEG